ncbi:MAG TPA: hypothetical protein VFF73_01590 [Planctomycetota bacterium]|nr:hypothetical protein [Planctomycetota bacterium]
MADRGENTLEPATARLDDAPALGPNPAIRPQWRRDERFETIAWLLVLIAAGVLTAVALVIVRYR